MNLNDLLEEFNVVIDTAQGLTELRSLILGLAVRGKLVPQDPNDESASELLKKIEEEKQRLYEMGEIRKPKKLPSVSKREIPFELPKSWVWCRLGSVYGDIGTTKPESKFSYIDVGTINNTSFEIDYSNVENISAEDAPSRARRKVKEGSVIYSTVRPYLMNVAIVENSFKHEPIASTAFEVLNVFSGLSNKYVFRYLLSDVFLDYVNFKMVGVAYPAINKGDMQTAIIPIPPLTEQHRIVQKIESLFAEVDELEAKLNQQTKLDEKLQLAVNTEVQQSPDANASKSAWSFITSNFETLYHTPEAIDNLKKNILNEAVRGRLVPQDPNDEPASELLKKIEAEKQRLYDEGEIRKPKKLPPVMEDEIPFDIPEVWEWVKLGNIIQVSSGDGLTKSKMEEGSIQVFGGNGISGYHNEYNRDRETLVIGRVGYYCGATHITPAKSWVTDNAFITKFPEQYIYINFLNWALRATDLQQNEGSTAQPVISGRKIYPIPFALPPLEEQHRIVRRIEDLFAICDRFKAQLEQREKVNERLVQGLVGEVLEGS